MDLSDLPHQGLCSLCFQESEHFISIQTVVSLNDVEIGKELTTVDRNENNVIVFQEMLKDTGFFSGIFSLKVSLVESEPTSTLAINISFISDWRFAAICLSILFPNC